MSGDDADPYERAERLGHAVVERHPDDPVLAETIGEFLATLHELVTRVDQLRDQTDEDAALAELLEQERHRYRELFDKAPDPYVVTNASGVVRQCNRRARDVLHQWPVGRPLVLLVAKDERIAFNRFLDACARGSERAETTMTFLGRDAMLRMQIQCSLLDPDQLLWLLRDVTESERAGARLAEVAERDRSLAEQLRALDELRSAFLLAVSHDLRAPLAAIATLAAVLAERPNLAAAQQRRVVGQIRFSADRVVELLTDLLDLERLERRDLALRIDDVDVRAAVAAVVRQVELGGRQLTVDAANDVVRIDPLLFSRILENLLRNAVQHTPENTHIWIRCRFEPDGFLLVVEDDGPGVPPALAPTVFEPFQRERRPGGADGLGVGLTIVRRFAELHHGQAHLESRQGGGASFHVLLTTEQDAAAGLMDG